MLTISTCSSACEPPLESLTTLENLGISTPVRWQGWLKVSRRDLLEHSPTPFRTRYVIITATSMIQWKGTTETMAEMYHDHESNEGGQPLLLLSHQLSHSSSSPEPNLTTLGDEHAMTTDDAPASGGAPTRAPQDAREP